MAISGYDPVIVFDWLEVEGTRREDGRFTKLRGKWLEDTHRNTIDRWALAANTDPEYRVPFARFSDVLFYYGIEYWEFETWAKEVYGWDAFKSGDEEGDELLP